MSPNLACRLRFHEVAPIDDVLKPDPLRMVPFEFNKPNITGYSACWRGRILHLQAHTEGEDLAFYGDIDAHQRSAVWIYMPVDPGELLSELWHRAGRTYEGVAMMLRTNQGRLATVGPRFPPWWPASPVWRRLLASPKLPSRIYFDVSQRGISRLAMDCSPTPAAKSPLAEICECPYPKQVANDALFHTVTTLEDVAEITICQMRSESYRPVIGLLILYRNGHRASVGQYRLDHVRETLTVETSPKLCFGFARTKYHHAYIAKVTLFPPSDRMSYQWLDVPWKGRLEWWFSHEQSQLYHDGQISPPLF